MRITITGRNIELTEGLKAAVEEKLSKLEKFFAPDTNVFVTLSVEKERQKIEVTIPIKGHVIRSEQSSNDMYVSIDLVEEVIERQLRKYRTKLASKKMNVAENFSEAFIDSDADEDEEIKIVRTKRFGMKPMYPEDACVQMELTGHDFFVFRNAETDEVNVVYKRKGNTFGLIEPECLFIETGGHPLDALFLCKMHYLYSNTLCKKHTRIASLHQICNKI